MTLPPLHIKHGDECRRLRAEGLSARAIAKHIGTISDTTVRSILDENTRQKAIARDRLAKRRRERKYEGKPRMKVAAAKPKPSPPHRPTPEQIRAACVDFGKGRITRDALMRRITPRDKWSGQSWLVG